MDNTPYSPQELLALGFSSVGSDLRVSRRAVFHAISGHLGDRVRIDDMAILTGHIELGDDVHVSPFCFLGGTGGRIAMGRKSGISTHVSIFTKSDDYRDAAGADRAKVEGDVSIGADSILGAQCVVLPGTEIGSNCAIGVGCVIQGTIEPASRIVSAGIRTVRLA